MEERLPLITQLIAGAIVGIGGSILSTAVEIGKTKSGARKARPGFLSDGDVTRPR
ncbi:hypothetical protein [Rhizobium mongolense]|uniref:Uncharacterized protein n=2 Tax=Rhizobium mongolense TaxID=57676 RepID=A0ABR6IMQ8_9HYPH|nr:hypothetical protein [Rhizobium mongolense]MBB4229177.1 hypothetical protein [Rhizobium mongolense]TVZ63272.1 hypothetical protein BCL32_3400 [Rhizobium mongolense USDA 1844]